MEVQRSADNDNHLHEQPTLLYALVIYCHLAATADSTNVQLAWAYVAIRPLHGLVQGPRNFLPVRFAVFSCGTGVLATIAVRYVLALG